MTLQELFNEYRHYGIIEKKEDFEFKSDDIFVTMFVITYDNTTRLFFLRNGKAVYTEKLKRD